ncbi:MAG: aspartate/tyrosine/aromatic aminotransferase [Chthonomonadales bacterium]|nr:aspartate/tyrosine/aromatic aminotransferase [Chthonomonadales bacterium]
MRPSPFADVPDAPPDPILGLTEAFAADVNPRKVNLGVGVYQDASGRVPLLDCVRQASERWLLAEPTKAYLPIDGLPAYNAAAQDLLLGAGSPARRSGRAVTVETLGGTGALRVGAELLRRFLPSAVAYISSPTWENHRGVLEAAGLRVETYPYYDAATRALSFPAMLRALGAMPAGAVVVLHACCHNPTGVDPTPEQWEAIVAACREGGLVPFVDLAYQGFAEGLEGDALAVRLLAEAGAPFLVASSFSKSLSLYRERVGALTVVAASEDEARRLRTQLKRIIRASYSNPPSWGGQVAALVLGDSGLRARWEEELAAMRTRIRAMRVAFAAALRERATRRDFSFVERQRGMFSFLGIPLEEVRRLRAEYGLYVVDSGRICVAAINEGNLGYICDAIARVERG